ncbi:MAG TPA: hypothetical protein VK525_14470 [Candidatus Saccharimonadales bacterium]|nr:hypothetical protein [Candidatus Saccharimonadales bacterium]
MNSTFLLKLAKDLLPILLKPLAQRNCCAVNSTSYGRNPAINSTPCCAPCDG